MRKYLDLSAHKFYVFYHAFIQDAHVTLILYREKNDRFSNVYNACGRGYLSKVMTSHNFTFVLIENPACD